MNSISKVAKLMIEVIGIIGLVAGLIFSILLIKDNFSPASESKVDSAYPPPVATAASSTPTVNAEKNPTPEPKPTATPELLENGWYLYRDPDGEFSFEYPKDSLLITNIRKTDSSKIIRVKFYLDVPGYQGMSIEVVPNPKNLQGMEIINELYQNKIYASSDEMKNSYKEIEIKGVKGFSAVMPMMNAEITIFIPMKDKYFMISPVHSTAATNVDKQTLEIFYKVIESLKY